MNNFHYKGIDWYGLLGFNWNEMDNSKLRRGEYCSKYIEVAYQNCLSFLDCDNANKINISSSEKGTKNNFDWTPRIIAGGMLVSVIILIIVIRKKKKLNNE